MSPVRSKTAPRSAETRTETADVSLKRKALSLALFLIVAASMLNALFGDRGLLELLRARQEIESLDREIATLRTQNQGLLGEIRDLKTSPLAVERLARENLALVKPGEIVLLIRETEVDTELADSIGRAGQANQERSETAP
jgi:cell division protein FtsB